MSTTTCPPSAPGTPWVYAAAAAILGVAAVLSAGLRAIRSAPVETLTVPE